VIFYGCSLFLSFYLFAFHSILRDLLNPELKKKKKTCQKRKRTKSRKIRNEKVKQGKKLRKKSLITEKEKDIERKSN
jgi:hypothetical protein